MKWELGYSHSYSTPPSEFVEAYVPSDVQLIWQEQKGLPDYRYRNNYEEYRWMEDCYWFYRTELRVDQRPGLEPVLKLTRLDYRYSVFLGDSLVADGEGLYTPVCLDMRPYQNTTVLLTVVLHPVPKRPGVPEGRAEASLSCIPPVSYGWDWHPRLIPIGICGDVELQYLPPSRIEAVDVTYDITDDMELVQGTISVHVRQPKGLVSLRLLDAEGRCVFQQTARAAEDTRLPLHLEHPRLWWCHNQGEPHLYTLCVSLEEEGRMLNSCSHRTGFRRIRLRFNEDVFSKQFPMTEGLPPITIELNGRKIFGKGSNFVQPEIFTAAIGRESYENLLRMAKDAHMNLLRMWGGAMVGKESMFDLCDEMGIMVWQEFPLACNNYEDDPTYLRLLDKESRSILRQLKPHPSVVLWCGGNELLVNPVGMTPQSLPLRLLDKNCLELDPKTPYIQSSPQSGMGHGYYLPLSRPGREFLSDMVESYFTAYTEFGIPAPSSLDYIRTFTPEEEVYRPEKGTAWEYHHAVCGWEVSREDTWFCKEDIRWYFGRENSLEELIANGQLLQAEVYAHIFEEARRKWPHTSMALNWCYNEPWPSAANNSIVVYPDIPKPGYYGVQKALRDRCLSIRLYKMCWQPGETVTGELFMLNDLASVMPATGVSITLADDRGNILLDLGRFETGDCAPCSVLTCAAFTFALPDNGEKRFWLEAKCEREEWNNRYLLLRHT